MVKGSKHRTVSLERMSRSMKASPFHRSKHQSGEKNASYKSGWWLDKNGYRMIRVDGKDKPEHRHVMEQMIGRALLPHETVHHKNGQRDDNRPQNLELWSSRNPKGQRIADKIEFAHELLREYGNDGRFTVHDMCMGWSLG
jgi:HNH endonuclease